jgi:hypothetical protein
MSGNEWTPLDDLHRSAAAITDGLVRAEVALRRVRAAKAAALRAMDGFLAQLGDGQVDWSEATPEEAAEMLAALDMIREARAVVAGTIETQEAV